MISEDVTSRSGGPPGSSEIGPYLGERARSGDQTATTSVTPPARMTARMDRAGGRRPVE